MKYLKTTEFALFVIAILVVVSGCATLTDKKKMRVTIEPSRSYEECVELLQGQELEYSFMASQPVDFNIHYHAEDKIYYPVDERGIFTSQGTVSPDDYNFYTEEQEYFCMMWENSHHRRVTVRYQYSTK
jgi:hypothetical protein